MAATIMRTTVDSISALDAAITSYGAQGFDVLNKTSRGVTLVKRKRGFSFFLFGGGFFLFVVPSVIYLIWYFSQKDVIVEIALAGGAT